MCQLEHETQVIYIIVFVNKKIAFADKCNNYDICTVNILLILSNSKSTCIGKNYKALQVIVEIILKHIFIQEGIQFPFCFISKYFPQLIYFSFLVRKNYGSFKFVPKLPYQITLRRHYGVLGQPIMLLLLLPYVVA